MQGSEDSSDELEITTQIPADISEPSNQQHNIVSQPTVTFIAKDMFSLYSLSFICKSKDLSERKIKLDFNLVGEVRKLLNNSILSKINNSPIFLSAYFIFFRFLEFEVNLVELNLQQLLVLNKRRMRQHASGILHSYKR